MAALLELDQVTAGYGASVVLDGVSLTIAEADALAVLGRNGVGKTTLLATIMGHTNLRAGRIAFAGREIGALAPYRRARLGIGFVPQEREVFGSLTVAENLAVAARGGAWSASRVYDLFPPLADRRGNRGSQLSGGEQQMLAIARALMTNPALLLLDEPLEGLAPIIVEELTGAIGRMIKEQGTAVILIEQHAEVVLSLTRDAVVMERGVIVHRAPSGELLNDAATLDRLIGLRIEGGQQ